MKAVRFLGVGFLVLGAGLLAGCGQGDGAGQKPKADAIAVMVPTLGSQTAGVVEFVKTPQGVRILATMAKLSAGEHGFHIHEFGDCSSADAASAGGHYNPGGHPHAGPDADQRHVGDLGNIVADASGSARFDAVIAGVTLEGPDSVIGRSVVVHADPDDLTTQPAGSSGKRLACGVIGIAGR
jgi:Cu-Zn family superoxide dismutase